MKRRHSQKLATIFALACSLLVTPASAQNADLKYETNFLFGSGGLFGFGATRPTQPTTPTQPQGPIYRSWMSPEVQGAWNLGFLGDGTTVTVIDDFRNRNITGNLGDGSRRESHGYWTSTQIDMIAPEADIVRRDFTASPSAINLVAGDLNILNLSYSLRGRAGQNVVLDRTQQSIVNHARNGAAVIAKAAGNYSIAIDGVDSSGNTDHLNRALIGTEGTLFVGALDRNGTPSNPARLASYSNFAGSNVIAQQQFITVGVESGKHRLAGTSFAAPVVAGYAAILGDKFQGAGAGQIVDQLLSTARKDTIAGYNPAIHGVGEASLSRALAPMALQ